MKGYKGWFDVLVSGYMLGHLISSALIFSLLWLSWNYFRKRSSFKIERFVRAGAILLLLLALNQLRHLSGLLWNIKFVFVFLDFGLAAVSMFMIYDLIYFLKVVRTYPTPAKLELINEQKSEAIFTSQLYIQSMWASHLDQTNTARVVSRELAIPSNEINIEEVRRRMTAFAQMGENEESEHFDLNQILATAKKELAEEIAGRKLEIMSEVLPTIHCYPAQMLWLFKEIIRNVTKHNLDEHPSLMVFEEELKDDWMVIFEDNGEGMYQKYQKQFFNLFKVDPQGRIDFAKGSGLAMCRKIMRNHRGHIWMESDYYAGVVMYILVPKFLVLNPRDIPEYTYPD